MQAMAPANAKVPPSKRHIHTVSPIILHISTVKAIRFRAALIKIHELCDVSFDSSGSILAMAYIRKQIIRRISI